MENGIAAFEIKVTWHEAGAPYSHTIHGANGVRMLRELFDAIDGHDYRGHMFEVWAKKEGQAPTPLSWAELDTLRKAAP